MKVKKVNVLNEIDLVEAMNVDKFRLDEEAKFQAVLMAKVWKKYSEIYFEKCQAELDLDILKDTLGDDIKNNPENWGIEPKEKISEAMINRVIIRDEEYQKQLENFNKLKALTIEWEGMTKASEKRDNNIGRLWAMWEKNYYTKGE